MELVVPFTEIAQEDCLCGGCSKVVIPRGSPYFPISLSKPGQPDRDVCYNCFQWYLRWKDTKVRERRKCKPLISDFFRLLVC